MSVKSILFSTDEVRAILDGRKTLARRVTKPQPENPDYRFLEGRDDIDPIKFAAFTVRKEEILRAHINTRAGQTQYGLKYQVGDVLYVREPWARLLDAEGNLEYFYRADMENPTCHYKTQWRSNTQMPKEACRLFLRVTDVRVERLQEINGQGHHDDVLKEGWPFSSSNGAPINDFMRYWNIKNAKNGYDWQSNPFVWVYAFERCDKPEGWCE